MPSKVRMVPNVEAFVPACMRVYRSGIRTKPNEPNKRNMDPMSVIIAPMISIISILKKFFFQIFSNNDYSQKAEQAINYGNVKVYNASGKVRN